MITTLGTFALTVSSVIAATLLRGLTFSILWGWFIVPTFGLSTLSIPIAIGIALIVGFLIQTDTKNEKSLVENLISSISSSVVALFLGWVITKII